MAGLKQGGIIGVSNARQSFANDDVLLQALEYAATFNPKKCFSIPMNPASQKMAWRFMTAISHRIMGLPVFRGLPKRWHYPSSY